MTLDPRAWDVMQQSIGGLLAIILLLVLLALLRGRRRRAEARSMEGSRYAAVREIKDPQRLRKELRQTLDAYRQSHPLFCEILKAFQEKRSLDDLFENDEVEVAFGKLTFYKDQKERRVKERSVASLLLEKDDPGRGRDIKAAMVTILRALYLNPQFRRELSPAVEANLDRLLDSLTD